MRRMNIIVAVLVIAEMAQGAWGERREGGRDFGDGGGGEGRVPNRDIDNLVEKIGYVRRIVSDIEKSKPILGSNIDIITEGVDETVKECMFSNIMKKKWCQKSLKNKSGKKDSDGDSDEKQARNRRKRAGKERKVSGEEDDGVIDEEDRAESEDRGRKATEYLPKTTERTINRIGRTVGTLRPKRRERRSRGEQERTRNRRYDRYDRDDRYDKYDSRNEESDSEDKVVIRKRYRRIDPREESEESSEEYLRSEDIKIE